MRLLDSNGRLKSFEQWSNDVQSIASHQFGSRGCGRSMTRPLSGRIRRRSGSGLSVTRMCSPTSGGCRRRRPIRARIIASTGVRSSRWIIRSGRATGRATDGTASARWSRPTSTATGIKREDAVDPRKDRPHKGLGDNPGKSGSLFGQDHPYYPDSCSSCPFSGGLKTASACDLAARKGLQQLPPSLSNAIPDEEVERRKRNRAKYRELLKDSNYKNVKYNKRTGGLSAVHVGHIDHDNPKSERFLVT